MNRTPFRQLSVIVVLLILGLFTFKALPAQAQSGDTTPPVITYSLSGPLGNNGWYVSAVTVTWTVSDDESAITASSGCDPVTLYADTPGTAITCQATSEGGTTSVSTESIRIDQTPPTCQRTTSPGGSNFDPDIWVRWYVSTRIDRTGLSLFYTGTDQTSGMVGGGSYRYDYIGPNGIFNIELPCSDNAGNSTPFVITLYYDDQPPVILWAGAVLDNQCMGIPAWTYQRDTPGHWWTTPPYILFYAIDYGSGSIYPTNWCNLCTNQRYNGPEGANLTVNGQCHDRLGFTSALVSSSPFNYDATPPVITYLGRTPAPDASGWNDTPVTLSWSCTDTVSGAVSDTVEVTVSTDGAGQSATGTCQDIAGNVSTDIQTNINIHLPVSVVAPTATYTQRPGVYVVPSATSTSTVTPTSTSTSTDEPTPTSTSTQVTVSDPVVPPAPPLEPADPEPEPGAGVLWYIGGGLLGAGAIGRLIFFLLKGKK